MLVSDGDERDMGSLCGLSLLGRRSASRSATATVQLMGGVRGDQAYQQRYSLTERLQNTTCDKKQQIRIPGTVGVTSMIEGRDSGCFCLLVPQYNSSSSRRKERGKPSVTSSSVMNDKHW